MATRLPIPTASLPEDWHMWLAMILFGAFHGLNPGMGWLFALNLGLQQRSEKVIWLSLLPIALGHAIAVIAVVLLVLAGLQFIPLATVQKFSALALLAFGFYKLFNYYRHPRWVGMKVGGVDLVVWSFLMASAHGAGLMLVPALLGGSDAAHPHHGAHALPQGAGMFLAVGLHTLTMLLVMGTVAWVVYRKLGLAVLRSSWINFDLIWAVALLIVGSIALWMAFAH
ncbi:hypothetical protein [Microbulbifer donghaiensis]|nr:hypothetical protein [Microbulbifer donghaiensis]